MHKAHLSAGGANSAVGRATTGRCKKLSGDAGDAYSYCTVYGEKIYSLENMVLPNRERSKNMRHMRHPTRWLITPHPASDTNKGAGKPISIDVEQPFQEQWILNGQTGHPTDTSDPCQRPIQTDRHGQPPNRGVQLSGGGDRRWGECSQTALSNSR